MSGQEKERVDRPELSRRETLRQARRLGDLSLRDLERKSGIGNGYFNQLETGRIHDVGVSKVSLIAEAYGLPVEAVLSVFGLELTYEIDVELLALSQLLIQLRPEDKATVIDFAGYLAQKPNTAN